MLVEALGKLPVNLFDPQRFKLQLPCNVESLQPGKFGRLYGCLPFHCEELQFAKGLLYPYGLDCLALKGNLQQLFLLTYRSALYRESQKLKKNLSRVMLDSKLGLRNGG